MNETKNKFPRKVLTILDENSNCIPKFHVANIEGLISKNAQHKKIPFLRELCALEKPYFLAFAESHLNENIKEAEFNIPDYSYCASHRQQRKGGGVIIYINNNFTYKTLISASDTMCSIVAVYINELDLIVFMVYRPPPDHSTHYHGDILEKSFKDIVIDNINKVMIDYKSPVPDIIIAGDFNFPKALWKHGIGEAVATTRNEKRSLQQIIDVASDLNLLQKVTVGTRKSKSGNSNILELIFTNNHDLITNINIEHSEISDHDFIVCETSHNFRIKDNELTESEEINLLSYNYEKIDWELVKTSFREIHWKEILDNCSNSEEKILTFFKIISQIVDELGVKFKNSRGKAKTNIPRERRILLRNKKKLRNKLKKKGISNNKKINIETEIIDIDIQLLTSHQNERNNEEMHAIDNMKVNPKHFFAYAKKRIKTKSTIGPFKVNEELITSFEEISEKLSEQYTSSFSTPDLNHSIGNPEVFFSNNAGVDSTFLTDFDFTKEMIANEIRNNKNNSAPGPDHFPVILLQQCAEELSEPLYLLWRFSLDTGDIAPIFKKAIICPIQKANTQRCHPKSYRPVSLTSHIIKVFERIMRGSIVKHLVDNNLLPKNQHGFISGRSTLSQLLYQIEQMIRAWEEGKATDTIYLDFAKAFDKVDHNILCHKIKSLGITGKVGLWIREFLTGRNQQVSANGVLSSPAPVISGVPQGTVLGPILFIIMIDDLDCDLLYSVASKYADDTRVTARISDLEDAKGFQEELNEKIYTWGPANNMMLNGDKFEHLHVGNNLNQIKTDFKDPSGNIICEKEHIKDLGVIISNRLTWTRHTEEVVSKARVMSSWALRTFTTRKQDPMKTIWNSQVRPVLDYCSPLWSPSPTDFKNIDLLEGTQRNFTRRIDHMEGLNYAQRLKKLKMYSVQRRHERYKIIYIYKIKEGRVPNISDTHGLQFSQRGRHGCMCVMPFYPLYQNKAITARNSSFALTASSLWNTLPKSIRDISGISVDAFKRRLDKVLRNCPDEPRCSAIGLYTDMHGRTSNSIIHVLKDHQVRRNMEDVETDAGGLPRWPSSN